MTMSMYSSPDKMKMSAPSCFPGRYSPTYRSSEQMRRCMPNPSSRLLEDASLLCNSWSARQNGDIFAGINDGILSRAEALAHVDIGKHQTSHVHPSQMTTQMKHDVMYHHHSMAAPPQRPLQAVPDFRPISFGRMPPPMEIKDEQTLSTDVKYLFRIASSVSSGFCPEDLANIKPGPIVHSRWLTKASRLLRLYVTTNSPSENMQILAEYIMKVYVPMYFHVKYYSSVIYGSALLFKFIRSTQYLPRSHREIVNNVVQNNAYFAHSENVLLTMLFDDRKAVRERCIRKILHFRNNLCDPSTLRAYKKPSINFDCSDYVDMIDLDDDSILFEPPFTANIPYDHLLEYIEIEDPPVPDPRIPAHIQGTERFVQLLTNVSRRAIDNNRDDIMAVTIESRSKIPRMDSKKDLIPSAIDRIN